MFSPLHHTIARIWAVFRSRDLDRELDAELAMHIMLRTEDLIRQGMPPKEAAHMARIQLGGVAQLREAHRDTRGLPFIDTVLQDLRYTLRQIRSRPGFSALAITVLAIGIGANTAIFSLVNSVLLLPLPFKDPERLVTLFEKDVIDDNNPYNTVAPANFLDWQKQATTFDEIAATSFTSFNLSVNSKELSAERVDGCGASANLFETLGIAPVLGRPFSTEEDRPGARLLLLSAMGFGSAGSARRPMCCHSIYGWMENCFPLSA